MALVGAVAVSAGASAAGDDGVAAITALSGKAEIGTFLAWQQRPPAYTGVCIDKDIFLATSPAANDFSQWINTVF